MRSFKIKKRQTCQIFARIKGFGDINFLYGKARTLKALEVNLIRDKPRDHIFFSADHEEGFAFIPTTAGNIPLKTH